MISSVFNDKRTYRKNRASVSVLVMSFICFVLLGFIVYRNTKAIIVDKYRENSMDFAAVAAREIDGDVFDGITSEEDESWSEIRSVLFRYTASSRVKYVYSMKMDGDKLVFVVDADPDPESYAHFGEEYELIDDMKPALEGKICCDSKKTADRWGSYFSAYAPVFRSDGTVAGFVGVDTNLSDINRELNVIILQIIIQTAVFFALCVIIFTNFWSAFTKRDMLTGIMNYDSLVEQGCSLKKKNTLSEYTAVQVNIRNFKYINSKMGTNYGDILLQQYAGILSRYTEQNGYCARTGSDNFIILIKKGLEDDLIEKLSETWIDFSGYGVNETLQVLIRAGIYEISEEDSIQDAINCTSVALKSARASNRQHIVRFEKSMLDSVVNNNSIISDFRRALDEGEFKVYYQPKVNIDTGDLCGAEALIRWEKDGKIIPPMDFIPVLETEGLITDADFFVFETVCRNICDWEERGIKPVTVSSNFSKIHLSNPNFADNVLTIVNRFGIKPELLEIELTESSGYSDYDALTEFVSRMNKANIHTSIDDFGTGYSSLSMLKDISVDVVKIDKSFLGKSDENDIHQEKMLGNVIRMINDLDRTVICEGIEDREQIDFLRNADCSVVQGFFFDRPLPHDEFEKRLVSPHYDK